MTEPHARCKWNLYSTDTAINLTWVSPRGRIFWGGPTTENNKQQQLTIIGGGGPGGLDGGQEFGGGTSAAEGLSKPVRVTCA